MLRDVVQINSSIFSHYPRAKRLVAEISDTGLRGFEPLYDDAIDVGFAIRNSKTNNITRWSLSDTIHDQEFEVINWIFVPAPESVRANPTLAGYTLILFND